MRDLAELVDDRIPHVAAMCRELGEILDECYLQGAEPHPERWEPTSDVIGIVELGDWCVGKGYMDLALPVYRLAARWSLHPKIQAEVGNLFLQRAGVKSLPLCEHDIKEGGSDWDPECWIHDELKETPVFPDVKCMAELALQAFGAAWAFYYNGPYYEASGLGGLLALDGMRAAAETLDDVELLSAVCTAFRDWLGDRADLEIYEGLEPIVNKLRERFAWAEGSLEPRRQVERAKLAPQLESEFGDSWELLPAEVRDRLQDAEHWRLNLTEPEVDRSPVVLEYCRALEAMMRVRVGRALDDFAEAAGEQGEAFRSRFLGKSRGRRFGDLILSEFRCLGRRRAEEEPLLLQFWGQSGVEDVDSYVRALLAKIDTITLQYRNAAAHSGPVMGDAQVSRIRRIVVGPDGLLAELARLKTWRPMSPTNEGQEDTPE